MTRPECRPFVVAASSLMQTLPLSNFFVENLPQEKVVANSLDWNDCYHGERYTSMIFLIK